MNASDRLQRVLAGLNKLDFSKKGRLFSGINTHNSLEHELKKFEVAYNLKKEGFEVVIEAVFKDGSGIADVFIPEVDLVYEVLCSETQERFLSKKYPVKKIIPVVVKK